MEWGVSAVYGVGNLVYYSIVYSMMQFKLLSIYYSTLPASSSQLSL